MKKQEENLGPENIFFFFFGKIFVKETVWGLPHVYSHYKQIHPSIQPGSRFSVQARRISNSSINLTVRPSSLFKTFQLCIAIFIVLFLDVYKSQISLYNWKSYFPIKWTGTPMSVCRFDGGSLGWSFSQSQFHKKRRAVTLQMLLLAHLFIYMFNLYYRFI